MDGTPITVSSPRDNAVKNTQAGYGSDNSQSKSGNFGKLLDIADVDKPSRLREKKDMSGGEKMPADGDDLPRKHSAALETIQPVRKLSLDPSQSDMEHAIFIAPAKQIAALETSQPIAPGAVEIANNSENFTIPPEGLSPFLEIPAAAPLRRISGDQSIPVNLQSSEPVQTLQVASTAEEIVEFVAIDPSQKTAGQTPEKTTVVDTNSVWNNAKSLPAFAPAKPIDLAQSQLAAAPQSQTAGVASTLQPTTEVAALETGAIRHVAEPKPAAVYEEPVFIRENTAVTAAVAQKIANEKLALKKSEMQIEPADMAELQAVEEKLQQISLAARYSEADAITRRQIFASEWARAQTMAPQPQVSTHTAPLAPPTATHGIPEGGLPPFITTPAGAAPAVGKSTIRSSAANPGPSIDLKQHGWESSLTKNVGYMIRENLNNLQVKVSPAELGPIQIQISMEAEKMQLQINANHAVTREMLEQATPRLREMLADLGASSVDVNVAGEQQSADKYAQNNDTGNDARADNDIFVASAESDLQERPVTTISNSGLIDTFA